MIFENFEIHAEPFLTRATCKCGNNLIEVMNGWFSRAMFCYKCENVYIIKLVKVPDKKVNEEFLEQCRESAKKHSKKI